jgi:hypothetical protein
MCQAPKSKVLPERGANRYCFSKWSVPTWRSIEHGLDLLKKGIMWRARSGSKIQIWRDNWNPRPPSLKASLKKGRTRIRWVSQLMKPGRRERDDRVIKTCTYPHDANEVMKIRLSERDDKNFLAWHYERTWLFIVQSVYKLALEGEHAEMRQTSSSSHPDGTRPLYKKIWLMKVLPKARVFAWKLAQEGLATNSNRKCHHLMWDATSQICGWEAETGFHAVIRWTKARALCHELR